MVKLLDNSYCKINAFYQQRKLKIEKENVFGDINLHLNARKQR